uniref:Uncharacterized protein n=1 Tax=Oryza punctata TaxID=4537 RepID=A0A0E0M628_ORYPU
MDTNFAICDPVSGRYALLRVAPVGLDLYTDSAYLGAELRTDDSDAGRVVCSFEFVVILVTYYNMWGPRLCVFSSRSGAWTVHAYSESPRPGPPSCQCSAPSAATCTPTGASTG